MKTGFYCGFCAILGALAGAVGYDQGYRRCAYAHAARKPACIETAKKVSCEECEGDGKVEGQPCKFCNEFAPARCAVCLGTGKRIGVCPHCGGAGHLWLENRP